MSNHYHYEYAEARHDHRGEYADTGHEHGYHELAGVAEEYHRHYDLERQNESLRRELDSAYAAVRDVRADLDHETDMLRDALVRIRELEEALAAAADRIDALQKEHGNDMYRLWNHISNMPGGV